MNQLDPFDGNRCSEKEIHFTQKSLSKESETRGVFEGMSFKYPPVSKEDYINAYEEYVRRCAT